MMKNILIPTVFLRLSKLAQTDISILIVSKVSCLTHTVPKFRKTKYDSLKVSPNFFKTVFFITAETSTQ